MSNSDRKLEIVTEVPESAMVVFAHPDDAEIGSGGVIARWVAAGCEVTYVLCTNGDAGTADRDLAPAELARKRAPRAAGRRRLHGGAPPRDARATRTAGSRTRASSWATSSGPSAATAPTPSSSHDPYRMKGFQHRDHRKAGIVTTDAVYPFARDHLHFPEHIARRGPRAPQGARALVLGRRRARRHRGRDRGDRAADRRAGAPPEPDARLQRAGGRDHRRAREEGRRRAGRAATASSTAPRSAG